MTMTYAEFQQGEDYKVGMAGANLAVSIINNRTNKAYTSFVSGCTISASQEQLKVETVGDVEVKAGSTVSARRDYSVSINGFATPELLDEVGISSGKEVQDDYTIIKKIVNTRDPRASGVVVEVATGVRFASNTDPQGARGLVTFDLGGSAEHKYSGSEWAAKVGT